MSHPVTDYYSTTAFLRAAYFQLRVARWLLALFVVSLLFIMTDRSGAVAHLWQAQFASLVTMSGLALLGGAGHFLMIRVARTTRSGQYSRACELVCDRAVFSSLHIGGYAGEVFHVMAFAALLLMVFNVVCKDMTLVIALIVFLAPAVIAESAALGLSRRVWRHEQAVLNKLEASANRPSPTE